MFPVFDDAIIKFGDEMKKIIVLATVLAFLTLAFSGCKIWQKGEADTETLQVTEKESEYEFPIFSGKNIIFINDNVPFFSNAEIVDKSYFSFSELDELGRCRAAVACVGEDILPTQKREAIGSVRPTGWHTVKYDCIEDMYLYNRCHLIAYELCGVNADERNLITGTRFLNVSSMLQYENLVAKYVKDTGNHVMYRVTPYYSGDDLVAYGVLMEGYSVEDGGEGIQFSVFCYNIQPGIIIDYSNGDSVEDDNFEEESKPVTYILNKNSHRIHKTDCKGVLDMKEHNKIYFTGTMDEAMKMGYKPCQMCKP